MKSIKTRITEALIKVSEGVFSKEMIEQVEDRLEELGINSLTMLKWLVLMEEEFGIEFDMEDVLSTGIIWSLEKLELYIEQSEKEEVF
ncbi:acyl carrier protein [Paenibacillus sp. FSL H8-0537]|uniref:acyl carrier protein n=1 Tax=Paenibacillus sp. FSL H8-0537 TaxID=2921399 RepID=UPI003101AEB6